jgi:hypothetical protein
MDANGNIKVILNNPNLSTFEVLMQRDLEYILQREVSETEENFVQPLFTKSVVPEKFKFPTAKKSEEGFLDYARFTNVQPTTFMGAQENSQKYIDSNKHGAEQWFHSMINEALLTMKKYYCDEISESNKSSFINLYERPTISKALSCLADSKYIPNRMNHELPKYSGFLALKRKKKSNTKSPREVVGDFFDEYPLEFLKETWLYKYYCHTYKVIDLYNVHSAMFSLDNDSEEYYNIIKLNFPFSCLYNIRIKEFEKIYAAHA